MPSIGRRNAAGIVSRDEMKTVVVAAALIIEQRKILVTQRKKDSSHALLWEFPGGKVKEGEEPREALQRELMEELDVEAEVGMIFDAVFYSYPEYPILLLIYRCRVEKGLPKPVACQDVRWVTVRELEGLAMPPADDPIRKHLLSSREKLLLL
ncbi:MAG TPA: (deoxy)nucleoside triphosphate pyrophosphohydrolase [Thermodesulfobacteriota bacterium]|nr:(deoxy)nucleoside triphosphate pyrophosphohydrolase [Thermodesulfobacteriota bacterium]